MNLRPTAVAIALAASVTAVSPAAAQDKPVPPPIVDDPGMLQELVGGHCEICDRVLADPGRWRVQCLLSEVVDGPPRGTTGARLPTLERRGFRMDAEYFYPASSIKTCGVIAALQKMRALREKGWSIDLDTKLVFYPLFEGETIEDADPSNVETGTITLGQEIRKVCIVSNNESFNHLYEFVGHRQINEAMWNAGLDSVRITHRLSEFRTEEEHRRTPRISVVQEDGTEREIPERTSDLVPPTPEVAGLLVGEKHMTNDGELLDGPMDFSRKNRISVVDLQNMLVMLAAPEVDLGLTGFGLTAEDRAFVLESMAVYPRQSENPVYAAEEYPDEYAKNYLPGLRKVAPDADFTYYNKTGWAYGFSIDNACIVYKPTGKMFFLTTVMYANPDGVINDSDYAVEEVALPVMAHLGEVVARRVWGAGESDQPTSR